METYYYLCATCGFTGPYTDFKTTMGKTEAQIEAFRERMKTCPKCKGPARTASYEEEKAHGAPPDPIYQLAARVLLEGPAALDNPPPGPTPVVPRVHFQTWADKKVVVHFLRGGATGTLMVIETNGKTHHVPVPSTKLNDFRLSLYEDDLQVQVEKE